MVALGASLKLGCVGVNAVGAAKRRRKVQRERDDRRKAIVHLPGAHQRLVDASQWYDGALLLRAAVKAIPSIGGALDTLLAGIGPKYKEDRVIQFLAILNSRVARLESVPSKPSEELADMCLRAVRYASDTRSSAKRERFAAIVAKQAANPTNWDEADAALRLLNDLSEVHVAVLKRSIEAPIAQASFGNMRVVSLGVAPQRSDAFKIERLEDSLPQYSNVALTLACSELVSRGLLHDEGLGRYDTGALQFFRATDVAHWFVAIVSDPG